MYLQCKPLTRVISTYCLLWHAKYSLIWTFIQLTINHLVHVNIYDSGSSRIIWKKHLTHPGISRCSDCSICASKRNIFHRTDIILVSLSLLTLFFNVHQLPDEHSDNKGHCSQRFNLQLKQLAKYLACFSLNAPSFPSLILFPKLFEERLRQLQPWPELLGHKANNP